MLEALRIIVQVVQVQALVLMEDIQAAVLMIIAEAMEEVEVIVEVAVVVGAQE